MVRLIVAVVLLACLYGCSGGEPTIPDRPAFDQAVKGYLQRTGMGLKIAEYKHFALSEDGASAEAEIAMGYDGPGVSATKRFLFEFEKVDGVWRVARHKPK